MDHVRGPHLREMLETLSGPISRVLGGPYARGSMMAFL